MGKNREVATSLMFRYTLLRKALIKLLDIPLGNNKTVAKWLVIGTNGVVIECARDRSS